MRSRNGSMTTDILLQVGGTNVPEGATKELEDEIFGGCFRVVIFFLIITGFFILSTAVIIQHFI